MGKRLCLKRDQMILTKTAAILSIIIFALTVTFGSFAFAEGENLAELAAQVNETNAAMTALSDEIHALDQKIASVNTEIETTKQKNQELTTQLETGKAEMEERLRVMYMYNGSDDYLEILFSATTFSDFFARAEQVISIYKADRAQLNELTALQSEIQKNEEKLQADLIDLQSAMGESVQKEEELAALLSDRRAKLENAQIAAVNASTGGSLSGAASVSSGGTSSGDTSSGGASTGNATESASSSDFDLICAIVRHEAGASYEGALAVISCVMNRVDVGGWYGSDAVSVLTKPYQFESYTGGYYKQYLGAEISETRRAVRDCMEGGVRSHNYLSFRSAWYFEDLGYFPEGINIYGNYYFNAKD